MIRVEERKSTAEYADKEFILSDSEGQFAVLGVQMYPRIEPLGYVSFKLFYDPSRTTLRELRKMQDLLNMELFCNVDADNKIALRFAKFFGFVEVARDDQTICLTRK